MGAGASSYSGSYRYEHNKQAPKPKSWIYGAPASTHGTLAPAPEVSSAPWRAGRDPVTPVFEEGLGHGVRVRETTTEKSEPGLEERTAMAGRDVYGDKVGSEGRARDRVPSGDGWDNWGKAKAPGEEGGARASVEEDKENEVKGRDKEKGKGWLKSVLGSVVAFYKKKTYEIGRYGSGGMY